MEVLLWPFSNTLWAWEEIKHVLGQGHKGSYLLRIIYRGGSLVRNLIQSWCWNLVAGLIVRILLIYSVQIQIVPTLGQQGGPQGSATFLPTSLCMHTFRDRKSRVRSPRNSPVNLRKLSYILYYFQHEVKKRTPWDSLHIMGQEKELASKISYSS